MDKGQGFDGRPHNIWIEADDTVRDKAVSFALWAAREGAACYVIPGTVAETGRARAADIRHMQTVVVDLDTGDITAKRDHLVAHLGEPTLIVESGGRTDEGHDKLHVWWRLTEPAEGDDVAAVCRLRARIAAKVAGDIHFRSAHQPIRVAGSVYAKNGVRRLVRIAARSDREYDLAEFAAAVDAMPPLDGLDPPASCLDFNDAAADRGRVPDIFAHRVREGGVDGTTRFEAISRVIGYWIRRCRDGHVTPAEAWDEIVAYNEARVDPPWPMDRLRSESERLWKRDGENRGSTDPGAGDGGEGHGTLAPVLFTEDALAHDFSLRHGGDWRYVAGWGQWLQWTGTHWQRETTLRAYDLARAVCRDAARRCNNRKTSNRLSTAATVSAVERLARADRVHAATTEEWDRDLWALNTPGGILDLRSGASRPHDRAERMTKVTTATPGGECPTWRTFLATVTGGDPELRAYLARMAGYALTGVTSEHALFFLYGTGANGKSVFVNTLAAILGDYATNAPMDTFMVTHGDRHPSDMAGLRGARLVTSIETEQGRRWAESKLKALTGEDKISARFMRQDFFEFTPQFKLVVAGNHKPAIRNVDIAMRRRLHMVPFTVTIPDGQRDKTLPQKLLAERDGILAWALQGCLEWQRTGLQPPASVVAATEEYFEAEDALGRWLDECCRHNPGGFETTADLYASWKAWADAAGEFGGSQKRFSENLTVRDFDKYREPGTGRRGFRGLTLNDAARSSSFMETY